MKILYYIHALYVGGAETLITKYLINLNNSENEVVLVVNNEEDSFLTQELINAGIKIISLNKHKRSFLFKYVELAFRSIFGYSRKWRKIYKEEKPDIVHIHTHCDAFEICKTKPERVFFSFHSDVERSLSMGSKKNFRKLCKYAQKGITFVALNRNMVSDIKEKFKTDKIIYIPNAIDLANIRSNRYKRESFLKIYDLPDDSFLVGHVGRFHPVKNHKKLFSVFYEVHKRCPSARLILVGTGSSQEIEYIESLKEKYNLSDVTLMLGLRHDASALMSVFDTFVLTSTSESFSLVLLEAQAQGVRCITSNVVPSEVICENCFPLDLNQSDEVWADEILSNKTNHSNNIIEQFDISVVMKKMLDYYTDAAKKYDKD